MRQEGLLDYWLIKKLASNQALPINNCYVSVGSILVLTSWFPGKTIHGMIEAKFCYIKKETEISVKDPTGLKINLFPSYAPSRLL